MFHLILQVLWAVRKSLCWLRRFGKDDQRSCGLHPWSQECQGGHVPPHHGVPSGPEGTTRPESPKVSRVYLKLIRFMHLSYPRFTFGNFYKKIIVIAPFMSVNYLSNCIWSCFYIFADCVSTNKYNCTQNPVNLIKLRLTSRASARWRDNNSSIDPCIVIFCRLSMYVLSLCANKL